MSEHNRYREEEKELEQEQEQEQEEQDVKHHCKKENQSPGDHHCECNHDECCSENNSEELISENKRLQDLLLRNAAELENFKRRMNEERIRDRKYALEAFFREFVDIIDVFDQAVNIETKEEALKNFLIGFKMINDRIKSTLETEGVKKINAINQKFDPSFHHAVEKAFNQDIDEGLITEVIMNGYLYKDRVLRPSMVKVNSHEEEPVDDNENNKGGN